MNWDYFFSQLTELTLSTPLKVFIYIEKEQNIHVAGTLPVPFVKDWIKVSTVMKGGLIDGKTNSGISKNISLRNQLQMFSSPQMEYFAKNRNLYISNEKLFSTNWLYSWNKKTQVLQKYIRNKTLFQEEIEVCALLEMKLLCLRKNT